MKEKMLIIKSNGDKRYEELELPETEDSKEFSFAPAINERLAALESAMLSMMGVQSNV